MNNLLKTISGGPLKPALPEADLKLLLSSVRDVRSQDVKAADSFYGSLEGVLSELRTVTADNRDAEAFLKPVSRMEYPDYYELIKHPMDFGTMLKNVKARKYKSKQEFAADLNLIWKNCLKYNSGPDHILRGCVTRLKRKADHLLAHLSDRPDRITINGLPTPSAPPSSSSSRDSPYKPIKINGLINGFVSRDRLITPDPSTPQATLTPTPGPSNSHSYSKSPPVSTRESPAKPSPSSANAVSFEDQPALIRTPASMNMFVDLDREMQRALDGVPEEAGVLSMLSFDTKGKGKEPLVQKLRNLLDEDMDVDEEDHITDNGVAENSKVVDGVLKRKRPSGAQDQRKRPRLTDPFTSIDSALPGLEDTEEDLLETWWEAAQSNSLMMGGIPSLSQFDEMGDREGKVRVGPSVTAPAIIKQDGRKKGKRKRSSRQSKPSKSLLKLMNNNIATLTRVRRTHTKFVALNAASDPAMAPVPPVSALELASEHEAEEMVLAEEGWRVRGEVGREEADECLGWMGGKVLQHAGFQGSSKAALNVLTSVTSEYLQNVGRTIRFLCDKYSNTMTSEEIILHTLFESGTTEIQDLERYIKDDVVRYGGRLGDLEKKLVGAYRDVTSVEVPNEDGMFEEGDEADHFASGGLADILGGEEDFLGLRELGIQAEFGLKSLSVPKRLWKGKPTAEGRAAPERTNAGEPPPPFPPPPSFIPLESSKLDSQIGLLKDFYQERFTALAASTAPPQPPGATGFGAPPLPTPANSYPSLIPSAGPFVPPLTTPLTLLDDPPNPTRAKIGPLGQVIVSNTAAAKNKKAKAKEVAVVEKGKDIDPEASAPPPKKKESKKKKAKEEQTNSGAMEVDGHPGTDVNGTALKKKGPPKGTSSPKKSAKNPKPPDIPPAIVASA